jgi:hypothetical protein
MAVAWSQVQDAITAWIVATSGLDASEFGFDGGSGTGFDDGSFGEGESVLWVNQGAPQPDLPYATLKLSPARKTKNSIDAIVTSQDLTQTGQEMAETVTGQREVTLTVDVLSDVVTGDGTAMEFLENALTGLSLPSQRATLRLAGLSVVDWENPLDLSALVATAYQSRASADVRFYLVDTVTERTGYIETAEVTPTVDTVQLPIFDLTVG